MCDFAAAWTTCYSLESIWQTTSSSSTRKVRTQEMKTRYPTATQSSLYSLSSGFYMPKYWCC